MASKEAKQKRRSAFKKNHVTVWASKCFSEVQSGMLWRIAPDIRVSKPLYDMLVNITITFMNVLRVFLVVLVCGWGGGISFDAAFTPHGCFVGYVHSVDVLLKRMFSFPSRQWWQNCRIMCSGDDGCFRVGVPRMAKKAHYPLNLRLIASSPTKAY